MAKVTPLEMVPQSEPINSTPLAVSSGRLGGDSTTLRTSKESDHPDHHRLLPMISSNSFRVTSSMQVQRYSSHKAEVPNGSASIPATALAKARQRARRAMEKSGWYDSPIASAIRKFVRGRFFTILAMLSLFMALFFPDMWVLCQIPSNTELDVALSIVFFIFAVEWVCLSLTDASYLLGFFFWMDLIGTCSMLADISFLLGSSASEPVQVRRGGGNTENIIVVRAARAAKLGARAGRLSRVLKILRFLPFLNWSNEQDTKNLKMAKVISNQLTNVVSTRVAFLTICMVVLIPIFSLFNYPETDDSMYSWAEHLARSANKALSNPADTSLGSRLETEVARFADFYDKLTYGPYGLCVAQSGDPEYSGCDHESWMLNMDTDFSRPRRYASIRVVNYHGQLEAYFDFTVPTQHEAGMNIGLILFTILVMCTFGILMSSSITVIALRPLERMLATVRERCAQIVKYTANLEEDEDDEDYDDMEQAGEFMLLEKVVAKLAVIVDLSMSKEEPELKEEMNEDDIIKLNWMQGAQVKTIPVSPLQRPSSKLSKNHDPDESSNVTKSATSNMVAKSSTSNLASTLTTKCIPSEIIESLNTPSFNSLDLGKDLKLSVGMYIMITHEGSSEWVQANVEEAQLRKFMHAVEASYLPKPFHNFSHALDVEYSCARYMRMIGAAEFMSDVTQFWLIVGALAHDLGHTGFNNQYLVETAHELAIKYNDRSPLENFHCSKLFEILSEPEANIFMGTERDVYKEIRKGLINAILHTDVTKHNEMVKELSLMYQMNSEPFDSMQPASAIAASPANVQLVVNMLLHGADISNPMKPWVLCERLAHLCLDEFFAQGDLEKAGGLPVQMLNDRDKVNRPNSQVGFIEFVITPLVEASVRLFPPLDELADHLSFNIKKWCDIWQEQTVPAPAAETIAKTTTRVQRVVERCRGVMRNP